MQLLPSVNKSLDAFEGPAARSAIPSSLNNSADVLIQTERQERDLSLGYDLDSSLEKLVLMKSPKPAYRESSQPGSMQSPSIKSLRQQFNDDLEKMNKKLAAKVKRVTEQQLAQFMNKQSEPEA